MCSDPELDRLFDLLSPFEAGCLNWYVSNVNSFTMEVGMVGDLVRELEFDAFRRRLFLKSMNMIYQFQKQILAEKTRKAMEARRNG